MFYEPTERRQLTPSRKRKVASSKEMWYSSMTITIMNSLFKSNEMGKIIFTNEGGTLEFDKVVIKKNKVGFSLVTLLTGASLIMRNSYFEDNEAPNFMPIYIDKNSYLKINVNNTSTNNQGLSCDGAFLESEKSNCLDDILCDGICCAFGNETCGQKQGNATHKLAPIPNEDVLTANEEGNLDGDSNQHTMPELPQTDASKSTVAKEFNTSALIVSSFVLVAFVVLIFFLKRKRSNPTSRTSEDTMSLAPNIS